jgi:hypothetical protein
MKPKGMHPRERPRSRWEQQILKCHIKERRNIGGNYGRGTLGRQMERLGCQTYLKVEMLKEEQDNI